MSQQTGPYITQREWEDFVEAQDRLSAIEGMTDKQSEPFMIEWTRHRRTIFKFYGMYDREELDLRYKESLNRRDS